MLKLKVRPDPFTGRTINYMTEQRRTLNVDTGSYRPMDPGTFSGIGKDMGGIYMFAGKEKGGYMYFW